MHGACPAAAGGLDAEGAREAVGVGAIDAVAVGGIDAVAVGGIDAVAVDPEGDADVEAEADALLVALAEVVAESSPLHPASTVTTPNAAARPSACHRGRRARRTRSCVDLGHCAVSEPILGMLPRRPTRLRDPTAFDPPG